MCADVGRQTGSQDAAEAIGGAQGGPQTTGDEETDQRQQTQGSGQPRFLGDGDKNKIRNGHRDQAGTAQSGSTPGGTSVGNRHEGLHDLERASGWIEPGIEPGIHTQADHVEKKITGEPGQRQPNQTDEQDAFFPGGDEQDDGVEENENESRAQVTLDDKEQAEPDP